MNYTNDVEKIAKEHGIEFSVALDVKYLEELKQRIINCSKKHSGLRDFPVQNEELETFLIMHDC